MVEVLVVVEGVEVFLVLEEEVVLPLLELVMEEKEKEEVEVIPWTRNKMLTKKRNPPPPP